MLPNAAACSGNTINLKELTGATALSGSDAWAAETLALKTTSGRSCFPPHSGCRAG